MTDCEEWLFEKLKDGEWVLSDDVRSEAKAKGFTKKLLKDARKALKVTTFHQFDEVGAAQNWFWRLPKTGETL